MSGHTTEQARYDRVRVVRDAARRVLECIPETPRTAFEYDARHVAREVDALLAETAMQREALERIAWSVQTVKRAVEIARTALLGKRRFEALDVQDARLAWQAGEGALAEPRDRERLDGLETTEGVVLVAGTNLDGDRDCGGEASERRPVHMSNVQHVVRNCQGLGV